MVPSLMPQGEGPGAQGRVMLDPVYDLILISSNGED